MREPRPFPWRSLPKVDRRTNGVIEALARWAGARRSIETPAGPIRARAGTVSVLAGEALSRALGDPTSAVAVVRARGRLLPIAYAVAGGALVRGLARVILGGPDELDGPRPPTPAERGVLAYAVAAALIPDAHASAEPTESAGPLLALELRDACVIELEIDGACTGWAALVVPIDLLTAAPPRRPRETLPKSISPWLDEPAIEAHVILGAARFARGFTPAPRDVLVLADSAELRLARGGIPVTLARGVGGITVGGVYARGTMDETLGEDAAVEIAACAGSVTLSVRRVLELAPGQVIELGRPIGGEVELRVGRQVVGRGELVDVDGGLGVRVLSVEGGLARG
ncbi:MAG TPA: FliM/FliN family flagellar motor switch protein [Kofleriaceae bacterium]|nr:FliM/FliN family flagellar motor switch protein [Kofleriaceae bacterium]